MGPMEDEFDIGEEIEAQQEILILGMTFYIILALSFLAILKGLIG